MLKSYEAIYENGQIKWLAEQPDVSSARVVVTVLEETNNVADSGVSGLPAKKRTFPADMAGKIKFLDDEVTPPVKRRFPPVSIAGKGKTLGDLVSPIVPEEDWECLK